MNQTNDKLINALLIALICLDVFYVIIVFFFPESWFQFIHGTSYNDPQGLLRRTGAGWAAFALFHFITLIRWKETPNWLALSAGIRLTEIFTDWAYLYFSQDITWIGGISLFLAAPINALLGWYFFTSSVTAVKQKYGEG
ncbi:MAG TPA: hypothetical protein VKA68_03505 [bacterium]|nr:hypothetical protein [bacterium]